MLHIAYKNLRFNLISIKCYCSMSRELTAAPFFSLLFLFPETTKASQIENQQMLPHIEWEHFIARVFN